MRRSASLSSPASGSLSPTLGASSSVGVAQRKKSLEPSEVVQGFNVARDKLGALEITRDFENGGKDEVDEVDEKKNERDVALPRTPAKGGKKREEEKEEQMMTPKTMQRKVGKPDIKVMLAHGQNAPIDVMRGKGIITSMTLRAKAEGIKRVEEMAVRREMTMSSSAVLEEEEEEEEEGKGEEGEGEKEEEKENDNDYYEDEEDINLLLPAGLKTKDEGGSVKPILDENENSFEDPKEYRKLMVKLSDLSYIHIKAAVGVDKASGNVIERDFWLPLDKTQTIADLKRCVEEANTLEEMKMIRNRRKMLTNGTNHQHYSHHTTANTLEPVNENEEMESVVLLKGRELHDSRRLMDENVTHNTTLHFYVKKDAQNVTVKMHNSHDVELNMKADETAESLRGKISALSSSLNKNGNNQLDLYYDAKALKDGPLSDYGVRAGATLDLRPHVSTHNNVDGAMNIPRSRSYGSGGYDGPVPSSRFSWGSHNGNNNISKYAGSLDRSQRNASVSYVRKHRMRSSASGTDSTNDSVSPPEHPITPIGSFDMAREGLLAGVHPMLSSAGSGGAYFLKSTVGETVAVFKPSDEEPLAKNNPRGNSWVNGVNDDVNAKSNVSSAIQTSPDEGMRKGTKVGEGAAREVAAYLLDHDGFSGVPCTSLASLCEQSVFFSGDDDVLQRENEKNGKLGSIQEYIKADAEAEEFGPSLFPLEEVHKITVLDIRLANTDRNAGNILVKKDEQTGEIVTLIPIDHGYALPHTLEDIMFEWEFWPQAKLPYSEETKQYIESLDADEDIEYLRDNDIGLHSSSQRVFKICTMLLKKAAMRDVPPAKIASILSRAVPTRMSNAEKLVAKAASTAMCAVRSERGELVHKSPNNGSFWNDLDNEKCAEAEAIFMREFEKVLDAFLDKECELLSVNM